MAYYYLVQAAVSPALSPSAQPRLTSVYEVTPLSPSSSPFTLAYPPGPSLARNIQKEQVFPERPGEPECQYYMRNGDCKFGSSCRFHHPRERMMQGANFMLSPLGLPLRPVHIILSYLLFQIKYAKIMFRLCKNM